MKANIAYLKIRFFGSGGTASGAFGAIGSLHNVCHSLCVTVVSTLSVFGITLSVLPLMFLQTYQTYFWWAALAFTVASLYFYLEQPLPRKDRDRNFLILNVGLLLFGLPSKQLADYMDFFRFAGGSLVFAGVVLFLFGKRAHLVWRPVLVAGIQGMEAIDAPAQAAYQPATATLRVAALPKLTLRSTLFFIVIGSFLMNQYLLYRMGGLERIVSSASLPAVSVMKSASPRMKFSLFDVVLAKERMDKNSDGVCDVCGMSIEQCIDAGQLDCNMGNTNLNAIGVLGSQHIHADWKVYVTGEPVGFSGMSHMERMRSNLPVSSFIHVDSGAPPPEKTGDILHMHATNVPLWILFRSLGMKLEQGSLALADGRIFKNENNKTLRFYVNGQRVDDLVNYVFKDLDKILISYGAENDPDIERQLTSMTNFAKDH